MMRPVFHTNYDKQGKHSVVLLVWFAFFLFFFLSPNRQTHCFFSTSSLLPGDGAHGGVGRESVNGTQKSLSNSSTISTPRPSSDLDFFDSRALIGRWEEMLIVHLRRADVAPETRCVEGGSAYYSLYG